MKSATEYLWFETREKRELVNITERVAAVVVKSGIAEGMVLVSAMHITAGVFVNDHEPGLWGDIWEWLQALAPEGPDYAHQVMVPITAGALDLGPWQQIFYAEFDGKRRKRLVVKAMGE